MSGDTAEWGSQAWMQDSLADSEQDRRAINDSLA
ncbi:MAG: hypothetical protein ACI9VR_003408, partial [Cognaticolwellia sp.]